MIYLAFVPLLAFFVGMCWIVAQPNSSYVGPLPWMIELGRSMTRASRMMGAALVPAIKFAVEATKQFALQLERSGLDLLDHDNWPVHQPAAPEAPIPGRHWYAGCEPGGDYDYELGQYTGEGPRVNPLTGICEGCGEHACPVCGREHDEEECPPWR